jgi:PAS domain S-box-containing protein
MGWIRDVLACRGDERGERRHSEALFRTVVESAHAGIAGTAQDGRFLVVNQRFCELVGWSVEDLIGTGLHRILHPEDLASETALLEELLAGRVAQVSGERRWIRRDGTLLWVRVATSLWRDLGGQPSGFVIAALASTTPDSTKADGADAQRSRERLTEHRLRAILDTTLEYLCLLDRDGTLLEASQAFLSFTDIPAREMSGRPYRDWPGVPPGLRELLARGLQDAVQGRPVHQRLVLPTAGGGGVTVDLALRPVRDQTGEVELVLLEGRVASQELDPRAPARDPGPGSTGARELLGLAAEEVGVAACHWDLQTGALQLSPRAAHLLGVAAGAVPRTTASWLEHVHPDDRPRVAEELEQCIASDTCRDIEYRVSWPDGSVHWLASRSVVTRDASGRPRSLRGILMEVTERRRLAEALREREEELLQVQRIEAVGRLAGGIAHDLNNLLVVLTINTALLRQQLPEAAELQEIARAAERGAALTRQLLALSQRPRGVAQRVDLNAEIRELTRILERILGDTIALETVLGAHNPVWIDPGQVDQLLMSLATNARDAMPHGGHVRIETGDVEGRAADGTALPQVELIFTDTGVGMDDEIRRRAFEPFFTTKEVNHGAGLGLATVEGIVQQAGGEVTVESRPGQGTAFRILLPAMIERRTAAGPGEPATIATGPGASTILLVEDDEPVRRLTQRVLEAHGYEVLSAPSGEEAIELCRQLPGPPAMVVTDVVMPGMGGLVFAEHLRAMFPQVKILFVSGYSHHQLPEDAHLLKPYTPAVLVQKLQEMLGR